MAERAGDRPLPVDRALRRPLEIGVLGPLRVTVHGRPVDVGPRKQRLLLLRLVAGQGRAVPHDQLVEALWGDDPPGAPHVSLRSYVSNLRKLLEPDRPRWAPSILVALDDSYALTLGEGVLDADRFAEDLRDVRAAASAELRHARAERALRRWRGAPFADAAGAPFTVALAASWSSLRREVTEERARALLELGRYGEAIAAGEEMVADDPLAERGWAHLAISHYRSGRQADALAAIGSAREVLREQLGVDPGADLRELEIKILEHDEALLATAPARPVGPDRAMLAPEPLVGREDELDVVLACLGGQASGAPAVVVVTGAPGIGKTHLVDAAVDEIGEVVLPLRVACDPAAGGVGLLAIAAAVREVLELVAEDEADQLLGTDGEVLAELLRPGRAPTVQPDVAADEPERFRLFDGLARLLGRLSARRRVLLVVEDAHRAGLGLWEFLGFLLTRRSPTPMAMVVTARATEVSRGALPHLARIQSAPGARVVELGPLDAAAVAELVVRQLGPAASTIAPEIHRRAAGNPLFARELLRSIDPDDPVASLGRLDPPATLRQVIVGRIAELPEPADDLLTVAALLGSPFDLRVASEVVGLTPAAAAEVVDAACRRGLLVELDGRADHLAFRHDIVRETIESEVTRLRRAHWHARIGEHLAGAGDRDDPAVASEIAHHLARGALAGTALAAATAALTAIEAAFARHEPDLARRQAETAIEALDHAPVGTERTRLRSRLCCELSVACRRLGDLAAAHVASRQAFDAAAELGDLSVMARAAVTLAGGPPVAPWWGFWSPVPDASNLVEQLLGSAAEGIRPPDLVLLWCARAADLSGRGRFGEADEVLRRAVALADAEGRPELQIAAALGSWRVADLGGSDRERRHRADEVLTRARAADFVPGLAVGLRCVAGHLLEAGDLRAARRVAGRIEALAEERRSEPVAYEAATLGIALDLFEGRLDVAERGLLTALDRFGHFGRGWLGVLDLQFVRLFYEQHRVHLLEGQLRTRLAEHDSPAWRAGLVAMLVAHDRHAEARAMLRDVPHTELVRFGEPSVQFVPAALFADAVVDLADRERASRLLDVLEPRADRLVSMSNGLLFCGWLSLPVGRLLGLVERFDDARRHLLDARARAADAGSPLFELRARLALAELDGRTGDLDAAVPGRLRDEAVGAGYEGLASWARRLGSSGSRLAG